MGVNVARGTFEVSIAPEPSELEGAVGRHSLRKVFHGDLEGESAGIMLGAGDPSSGSAGYVAVEAVKGRLHGREGTFVFAQLGIMHAGSQTVHYEVVPGSATAELEGLTGSLVLTIDADGSHRFEVSYEL